MFIYYLRLAAGSIVRTPVISTITVLAIGLGISVSTTMITLKHVFAQNPIPHKSEQLFNVRLDSWGTDGSVTSWPEGDPPKQVTYQDMNRIRKSDIPVRQSAVATVRVTAFPSEQDQQPFKTNATLCHEDFFFMFEVPFRFGAPWTEEADRSAEPVVVLSHEGNQRFFGGGDSVGKELRLGPQIYKVVGVLKPWYPTPVYYDVINNAFSNPHPVFMPFDAIRDQSRQLTIWGNTDSWGSNSRDPDFLFTSSEMAWIQFWVELKPNQVDAYKTFSNNYALEQKAQGRFPRPLNNRVMDVMAWMQDREVAPAELSVLVVISLLFLVVCSLNLMGLLLGKFLSRAGLVGVHRALGAPRSAIFLQHLLECKLVGIVGSILGITGAFLGLKVIGKAIPSGYFRPEMFQLDGSMMLLALVLSLIASLIAGIYPAWRSCALAPAVQVKI